MRIGACSFSGGKMLKNGQVCKIIMKEIKLTGFEKVKKIKQKVRNTP